MDPHRISRLLAAGRVAVGLGLFLAPSRLGRGWLGEVADEPGTTVATRGLGARDLALGVGALATSDDPDRGRRWIEAGIVADVGDALATLLTADDRPAGATAAHVAVAGGAAALGAWLRATLPR